MISPNIASSSKPDCLQCISSSISHHHHSWDKATALPPLFTETIAALSNVDRPVIQFLSAGNEEDNDSIARKFACEATIRFGKVLLLSPRPARRNELGNDSVSRRMQELLGSRANRVTPDTQIPGLYYQQAAPTSLSGLLSNDANNQNRDEFGMIVVNSPAPSRDPMSLMITQKSHGSVLLVAAGVTRLESIKATVRQIQKSNGRLLGFAFFDAPASPWRKRVRS